MEDVAWKNLFIDEPHPIEGDEIFNDFFEQDIFSVYPSENGTFYWRETKK